MTGEGLKKIKTEYNNINVSTWITRGWRYCNKMEGMGSKEDKPPSQNGNSAFSFKYQFLYMFLF